MQDEQIAVVEQRGRRFVAYLVGKPHFSAEGATGEEALQNLEVAVQSYLHKQQQKAPLVQNVRVQTRQYR
jgi:predicted RNase H-like HicB family nuclease